MAKSYYSTVFEQSADAVWRVIRDFGNYTVWVEGVDESIVEDGKAGDAVGAVRKVTMGERVIRQKLLAHSDVERAYMYDFCPPSPLPVGNYLAQIKVTPIVDGERAFIEWWATFDCAPDQAAHWAEFYTKSFAGWLGSLRKYLDG